MRKIAIAVALLGVARVAGAQSSPFDIGGVTQFVADLAKQARTGTGVSINKQVHGVLYVPYPSLHSSDGSIEYAALGVGVDLQGTVNGTALHGAPLIVPTMSVSGLASLITRGNWMKSHLTYAQLGVDLDVGMGVDPLPVAGTHGKFIIGNQTLGIASIGHKFSVLQTSNPN